MCLQTIECPKLCFTPLKRRKLASEKECSSSFLESKPVASVSVPSKDEKNVQDDAVYMDYTEDMDVDTVADSFCGEPMDIEFEYECDSVRSEPMDIEFEYDDESVRGEPMDSEFEYEYDSVSCEPMDVEFDMDSMDISEEMEIDALCIGMAYSLA